MALNCAACGGVISDISFQAAFANGCDTHIKPEINLNQPTTKGE